MKSEKSDDSEGSLRKAGVFRKIFRRIEENDISNTASIHHGQTSSTFSQGVLRKNLINMK